MELLIIRVGNDYIRVRENGCERVQMDKASVFPMDKLDLVQEHRVRLLEDGYTEVTVKKLVVTEEDFTQ